MRRANADGSDMTSLTRFTKWIPLLLLTLIGGLHRGFDAVRGEMTADESFSWRLATESIGELLARTCNDAHPPGHYIALKLWINVWGDSLLTLRVLSILMGTACIPLAYMITRHALHSGPPPNLRKFGGDDNLTSVARQERTGSSWKDAGVCLSLWVPAVLVAFSPLQVEAASTIRMYSQGVFLFLFAMWMLVVASRHGRPVSLIRLLSYSVLMAGVAYSHNFGLLCLLAAGLAELHGLTARWIGPSVRCGATQSNLIDVEAPIVVKDEQNLDRTPKREDMFEIDSKTLGTCSAGGTSRSESWSGFHSLVVIGIPLVLYSPWLPSLVAQSTWIQEGFWLRSQSWEDWSQAFCYWAVGIPVTSLDLGLVVFALVLLIVGDAAWQGGRLRRVLFAVTVIPWIACLASDGLLERPLLQERYLTFSQASLFLLQGLAFVSLSPLRIAARVAAGLLLAVHVVVGVVDRPGIRYEPVGLRAAALWAAEEIREGDLVVHDFTETYNAVRYYVGREGLDPRIVRFPEFRPMGRLMLGQRASFSAEDYLDWDRIPSGTRRIWLISRRPPGIVPNWRAVHGGGFSVASIKGLWIEVTLWEPLAR